MDWPPQSLDLNITGAMWDHFDREPNKRKPTSLNVLQKVVIPNIDIKASQNDKSVNKSLYVLLIFLV